MSVTQTQLKMDHPFVAAILDGEHDHELDYIQQACAARMKQRFRKGARIEVISGKMMGQQGTVSKVNPKRVSVVMDDQGLWNIPPTMLNVLPAERSETDGLR